MKLQHFTQIMASAFLCLGCASAAFADNQTPTVSQILTDKTLPFRVRLEKADFKLPRGVQSYVHAVHKDKWLIVAGRVGGLHGFVEDSEDNFPAREQNTFLYVIDPIKEDVYRRSLLDPKSGLTQEQIDLLSVTAPQGYQRGKTLYMTGGYGVDSSTGRFDTKNALTAIDIPGLIHWVVNPSSNETAAQHIRQIFDDIFKVTGGYMSQTENNPTLLVMGQEFNGFYANASQQPPEFQQYTNQVRRFRIIDDGVNLSFKPEIALPPIPDPNYRRRDLNVVPVVRPVNGNFISSFVVYSGVFTESFGVWTVPVEITPDGYPSMADPSLPTTFKQGMNNYDCATFGLFSEKTGDMYTLLLGGISFGFFEQTGSQFQFMTDNEFPFIGQTTAIKIDKAGNYTQHFMPGASFPLIRSKKVHKGNPLLFGSEAEVILLDDVSKFSNEVVKLDKICKPTLIGYVVGGIVSTVPNTTQSQIETAPSPLLFKVIVEPVR